MARQNGPRQPRIWRPLPGLCPDPARHATLPGYPSTPNGQNASKSKTLEKVGLKATNAHQQHTIDLMNQFDRIICALFASRFFWELYRAPIRRKFLRWGWLDLVAATPEIEYLRGLRLARIVILVRLLRSTASAAHELAAILKLDRAYTVMTATFAIGIASMLGAAFVLLGVEAHAPGSNINTAGDALWWSLVTITSVGYGDYFPVTTVGRIVAGWLMVVGLGLVGSTTGLIASWIGGDRRRLGKSD